MKWNLRRAARLSMIAAVLACVALSWYQPLQDTANTQADAGMRRALVSFASARTLNAVISVLQGTEVSFQPLGVGVTLTLGQVLDPLNDLVEQFASLMLVASVAFGVQKALLVIGAHWAISAFASCVAVLWAVLHYRQEAPAWLSRALVVLVMVRLAVPVATVGSDLVFQQFLSKDYQAQQASLEATSREINQQTPTVPSTGSAQDKTLFERIKGQTAQLLPSPNVDFEAIKKSAAKLPERVVGLIVIFLLQTMIIPVLLLWALYRVVQSALQPARNLT